MSTSTSFLLGILVTVTATYIFSFTRSYMKGKKMLRYPLLHSSDAFKQISDTLSSALSIIPPPFRAAIPPFSKAGALADELHDRFTMTYETELRNTLASTVLTAELNELAVSWHNLLFETQLRTQNGQREWIRRRHAGVQFLFSVGTALSDRCLKWIHEVEREAGYWNSIAIAVDGDISPATLRELSERRLACENALKAIGVLYEVAWGSPEPMLREAIYRTATTSRYAASFVKFSGIS